MLAATTVRDFERLNGDQLRYMVASLCTKHKVHNVDDMVQEVYVWFIEKKILDRYDPEYGGRKVKLSTFLYSVIENVIRSRKSDNESQISNNRFIPPVNKDGSSGSHTDEVELALRYNDMAVEYENLVEQNDISDNLEGLSADLQDFEDNFLSADNKTYTLSRRKDKSVCTFGTSLVEVFRLLRQGYTSRDVSKKFGISDMFASNLKREIADSLQAYGLGPKKEIGALYQKLDKDMKRARSVTGRLNALYRFARNLNLN